MNKNKGSIKVIISGGGTGGHIFPAIAIANAIKEKQPESSILFVGAENRMEMDRVPKAGYPIIGLPVAGFNRQKLWKNISVLWKLVKSIFKAKRVIKDFRPDVAVGVGGFASGPTLKAAEMLNIPTLIQEQNSYAGVTNKLLAKKASRICVAYDNMERFFPKEKIILTGNPVRQNLLTTQYTKQEAVQSFSLDTDRPVVLILGGSLGAQSINECFLHHIDTMKKSNTQFIWQTGKLYIDRIQDFVSQKNLTNIVITDFISDMAKAYAAADLVVSRAGAGSISEFCLLGKAVLLIPSPNVAEDHQTQNTLALVEKEAAIYVKDKELKEKLLLTIEQNIQNKKVLAELQKNIKTLALPDSAAVIADEIIKLAENQHENR